jgi:glycosyltransferase involved in cell wall biosynthesis
MIDIFVALSNYESFGVSVLEAGACERPVVVSNAGGLPEIVVDRSTGFIVPRKDSLAAADAIECLVLDPERRSMMGRQARRRIAAMYALDRAVDKMLDAYHAVACPS